MSRINLVEAINQLETEKREIKQKYEADIAGLDMAIKKCREINTVCEKCAGAKGSTYRIVAEADPEWHNCSECHGTGKAKK